MELVPNFELDGVDKLVWLVRLAGLEVAPVDEIGFELLTGVELLSGADELPFELVGLELCRFEMLTLELD